MVHQSRGRNITDYRLLNDDKNCSVNLIQPRIVQVARLARRDALCRNNCKIVDLIQVEYERQFSDIAAYVMTYTHDVDARLSVLMSAHSRRFPDETRFRQEAAIELDSIFLRRDKFVENATSQVLIIDVDPAQRRCFIKSHLPRKREALRPRDCECVEKRGPAAGPGRLPPDARNKLINNCLNNNVTIYWLPRR